MFGISSPAHKQILNRVVALVRKRVDPKRSKGVSEFTRQFYERVPESDLLAADSSDLAGAAVGFWTFGSVRLPDRIKIRAFHPERETEGWTTPNTVIEIVNDDMPFLVDSVVNELARQGHTIELVIHPVMRIRRTRQGRVGRLLSRDSQDESQAIGESFMHVQIGRLSNEEQCAELVSNLERALLDVRAAVGDWPLMRSRVAQVLAELDALPPPLPTDELEESIQFLRWLDEGHFTFLGYREYRFARRKDLIRPEIVSESGLGLLRGNDRRVLDVVSDHGTLPADVHAFVKQPRLLLIGKAPQRSTVHRNAFLDMIGVKQFDRRRGVVGQKLFLGLFTSAAYNRSPQFIPLLRKKLRHIMTKAGPDPSGHDGKALLHILEIFPRDDLFQIDDDTLLELCGGMLNLQERHRTKLFAWRDPFDRFVSCFVFLPADRHNTRLRLRIQTILEQALDGQCRSYETRLDDNSVLARIHFVIGTTPGAVPEFDQVELERRVAEAVRSWSDKFRDALTTARGEAAAGALLDRYESAFGAAYQDTFDPGWAVIDVKQVEQVLQHRRPAIYLYQEEGQAPHEMRFRAYNLELPVPLSDAMPILDHFGLRAIEERPFSIRPVGDVPVWIHDFGLAHRDGTAIDLKAIRQNLREAVGRIWTGQMENDGYNRLVISAELSCEEVTLIRAYARFLRQAQIPFSETYMQDTLAVNPKLTKLIVELFTARFDPSNESENRDAEVDNTWRAIKESLDDVVSLDQDRILSAFASCVRATLRTNFYQLNEDGHGKAYLSFKLDSRQLQVLPSPRPLVEVFVYSPFMEGVHLRFGKVARGGIRWSDRREDFRTEVLGLVKAQQVKNAVIVPVGSKGGFVVKRPPVGGRREDLVQEGIRCYQALMRGLLDLTDNLVDGVIQKPTGVLCYDDDDPYLVVAADKGTASFSDIANEIAEEYDFWLGDAFASGGSAGYDHKKMGITARGAWESVKRHFRELDLDIQQSDFTVIGVGDMSGDVFGNGMLLSPHTKLIGAFNHLHIFVDPDPDCEKSFAERERLFNLTRSSWSDYDPDVLSAGGGVYDRSAKSISLSAAAKKRFGLRRVKVTPNELIRAMLQASTDLLWFGGIGTYIKSSHESNSDVGDRSNDTVRVDADQVKARVIGEGANLGVTQLGRVAFALKGGRLNTDAVDNSAGVDCSDHEVNIKILLRSVERAGELTRRKRDRLLIQMTDEVAELVLRDNYLQTGTLSVTQFIEQRLTDRLVSYMRWLERDGQLDRGLECLPDDETLADRKRDRIGLARPELCTLMAYAKIALYNELLESHFPDESHMSTELLRYFPAPLRETLADQIEQHQLRREIVATMTTNSMINRAGITFAHEVKEKTGKQFCDVARGFVISRQIFSLRELSRQIDALDGVVSAETQASMHYEVGRLIERATTWFLNHGGQPLEVGRLIEAYACGVQQVSDSLDDLLTDSDRQFVQRRTARFTTEGVPEPLAVKVAQLRTLVPACDIVRIAGEVGTDVFRAGSVYFGIGDRLGLDWLRRQAGNLPVNSHWENLAITSAVADLYFHQYRMAGTLLQAGQARDEPDTIVARCGEAHGERFRSVVALMDDLRLVDNVDLAMLSVANRQFNELLDSSHASV